MTLPVLHLHLQIVLFNRKLIGYFTEGWYETWIQITSFTYVRDNNTHCFPYL